MKSSRTRGKRELLHPIFIECKDRVENGFWKTLFEELAYGKYPKQFYVTQHQTLYSSQRDLFQYCFRDKTIDVIIHDIQELLTKHTNLISSEDLDIKKLENEKYKFETWIQWKDVKKKYIRELLLMDYCIFIKQQLQLTTISMKAVYRTLLHLVNNGQLININMKDNKIESIDGIQLNIEEQSIQILCDTLQEKEECNIECPDQITNYCKRFLLRYAILRDKK